MRWLVQAWRERGVEVVLMLEGMVVVVVVGGGVGSGVVVLVEEKCGGRGMGMVAELCGVGVAGGWMAFHIRGS